MGSQGRGRRAWETEAMERGEQVANGSMGWRGWQHEMQRARGFGARGGFKSEDEGIRGGAGEPHVVAARPRRACGSGGCGSGPLSLWLNDPAGTPLTSLARRRGG
jgi:hypothetical protein